MNTVTVRHKRKDYTFQRITNYRWVCDLDAQRCIQVHHAPSDAVRARPWRVFLFNAGTFKDMGPTSRFATVQRAGRAAMEYFGI